MNEPSPEPAADDDPDAYHDDDDGDDTESAADDDALLLAIAGAPDIPPPPAPRRAGETVGRFRLTEELGRGGMGVVYAAEDATLRRTVALKLLAEDAAGDVDRRRRFLREARSASAVSHPNVAAIYEVGEADGTAYIAMERVLGASLRELLDAGPIEVVETLRMGCQIARALAAAHQAGVVHRDLKPDNVMVGDQGAVKVLDFGLAKYEPSSLEPPGDTTSVLTEEGRIFGTPSYMSPEQASGRPLDRRADIFSLGVVLYELATGTRPFVGETSMDVLVAINRDHPEPASKRNPAVPTALSRLIAQCLEKRPEARPQHCSSIADTLAAIDARPRSRGRWISGAVAVAIASTAAFALAGLRRDTPSAVPALEVLPVLESTAGASTPTPLRETATPIPAAPEAAPGLPPAATTPSASSSASTRRPPAASPRSARRDPYSDQK